MTRGRWQYTRTDGQAASACGDRDRNSRSWCVVASSRYVYYVCNVITIINIIYVHTDIWTHTHKVMRKIIRLRCRFFRTTKNKKNKNYTYIDCRRYFIRMRTVYTPWFIKHIEFIPSWILNGEKSACSSRLVVKNGQNIISYTPMYTVIHTANIAHRILNSERVFIIIMSVSEAN